MSPVAIIVAFVNPYKLAILTVTLTCSRGEPHPSLLVSAETEEGVDALLAAIEARLAAARATLDLSIDASDGAGISWLHRNSEVLNKELRDGRFDMTVRVDPSKRDIVVSRFGAVPNISLTA
jgi:GTP-binding protein HflX